MEAKVKTKNIKKIAKEITNEIMEFPAIVAIVGENGIKSTILIRLVDYISTTELMDEELEKFLEGKNDYISSYLTHRRYNFPKSEEFEDFSPKDFMDWLEKNEKDIVFIDEVYLLDHGILSINYNEAFEEDPGGWDTSMIGYIFATKENIRRWGRRKRVTKKLCKEYKNFYDTIKEKFKAFVEGEIYEIDYIDEDYSSCHLIGHNSLILEIEYWLEQHLISENDRIFVSDDKELIEIFSFLNKDTYQRIIYQLIEGEVKEFPISDYVSDNISFTIIEVGE